MSFMRGHRTNKNKRGRREYEKSISEKWQVQVSSFKFHETSSKTKIREYNRKFENLKRNAVNAVQQHWCGVNNIYIYQLQMNGWTTHLKPNDDNAWRQQQQFTEIL